MDIPPNPDSFGFERNCEFVVDSHAGLTDLFESQARREGERQPRASVREQLKQAQEKAEKKSPVQAAPKKKVPERGRRPGESAVFSPISAFPRKNWRRLKVRWNSLAS